MISKFLVIGAPLAFAQSADHVMFGGPICAAVKADKVMIGLKGDRTCLKPTGAALTDAQLPQYFFGHQTKGLILLKTDDNSYLNNDALINTNVTASTTANPQHGYGRTNVYHVEEYNLNGTVCTPSAGATGCTGGLIQAGTALGDINKRAAFGFVGTASYLASSGTITATHNKFRVPVNTCNPADCNHVDNTKGQESPDICISKIDDTTRACSPARTFTPGTYKYSLYGATLGDGFATFIQSGPYTHVGARIEVDLSKMGAANIGDTYIKVGTDAAAIKVNALTSRAGITKLAICGATADDCRMEVSFPTDYNVGTLNSGVADNLHATPKTLSGDTTAKTDTVKINIVKCTTANPCNGFYLDFIFKVTGSPLATKDGYFVYDPEIKDLGANAGGATTGGNVGQQIANLLSGAAEKSVFGVLAATVASVFFSLM